MLATGTRSPWMFQLGTQLPNVSRPFQRTGAPARVVFFAEKARAPSRANETTTRPATGTSPPPGCRSATAVPAPPLNAAPSHATSAFTRERPERPASGAPSWRRNPARSTPRPLSATRCLHGGPRLPSVYDPSSSPPANVARASVASRPSGARWTSPVRSPKRSPATSKAGHVTSASTRNPRCLTLACQRSCTVPVEPRPDVEHSLQLGEFDRRVALGAPFGPGALAAGVHRPTPPAAAQPAQLPPQVRLAAPGQDRAGDRLHPRDPGRERAGAEDRRTDRVTPRPVPTRLDVAGREDDPVGQREPFDPKVLHLELTHQHPDPTGARGLRRATPAGYPCRRRRP